MKAILLLALLTLSLAATDDDSSDGGFDTYCTSQVEADSVNDCKGLKLGGEAKYCCLYTLTLSAKG